LDLHTLHVEHALLLAVYTLLTFMNTRMHRGTAGVSYFPVFALCACVGAVLVAMRGVIPDAYSVVLGSLMFPIGYVFLDRSMTEFLGHGKAQWRIQVGLAVLAAGAMAYWGVIQPDTSRRLMALSVILAAQLGMTAYFVVTQTPEYMRNAGWMMALVLALLCVGNLVRLASLFLQAVPNDYLKGGPMLAWSVMNTSVLQGGIIVAFVWMTAARLHHDVEVQALTDSLTGLYNRRALESMAERAIAASRRSREPVSAILFDLDDFKTINDSFGHLCGDAMLVAIARCLEQETRPGDVVARWGGDEFALLLGRTNLEAAKALAQRLQNAIERLRVRYHRDEVSTRASFGVGELTDSALGWDELILKCDRALYAVKDSGGNTVIAGS
jgi:diguanylate cyclase (GGDEF)-like protein